MSYLIAVFIVAAAVGLVWRFVRRAFNPQQPAEPVDEPLAPVPAPRRRGPTSKTDAVALQEPDDDQPLDAYPPREP